MLMTLGMLSLNLATQEIQSAAAAAQEAAVRHLAESGTDLIVQWFHDPRAVPGDVPAALFVKRYDLSETGPSFFDAGGQSQFSGTAENPDLLLDASQTADDRLLNDPETGWFRGLNNLGHILKLKLYGPARPGLLSTVDITAGRDGLAKTVSVQLGTYSIPPLRAGVQVGTSDLGAAGARARVPLPLWLHWGELKVIGDVFLGTSEDVPMKTPLAPVTGRSYAQMARKEDRWLELWIGGEAQVTPVAGSTSSEVPANVYAQQEPIPGLKIDRWEYQAMKEAAQLFGSYYVLGRDGLLYRNGIARAGMGQSPDDVFGSQGVGDHHGLVFVDTWNQQPPGPSNMGTLSLRSDYAEGLFVVNAHVSWNPLRSGQSVPSLSPPADGTSSLGYRIPVQLSGINLNGILYTAGDLPFTSTPRIYGALVAGGTVTQASGQSAPLEVWYNADLRSGLVRGVPLVFLAPGTWQERY